MKKLSLLICSLVAAFAAMAQAPQQLNYQGVVRNSVGNAITNQAVSLRLTIHDGAPNGVVVYSETRSVTTNAFGLYNVVIGSPGATNVIGTIAGINWNTGGGKYLQVEVDPAGGSAFITAGTSQMNSVPYAILASGAPPIGPAGGDLTGTYPNPLLLLPNSRTVNAATTLLTLTNSGASAGSNAFEGITNSTAGNASGVVGTVSSTTPGGFSAGVRGINNGTGGLGIGVWGSQAGSGWGVYGTANGGIGVNGSAASGIGINGSSNTGTGGRFTTTSGLALHTTGGVRLQGIGEAANRVLVSDATGNATWQVLGAGAGIGGSGTLNFLAKWTPDGSNLGTSVIYDDGANAGIGTTAPTHRLTVQHTGSTGISVSSTSGFSVVDINAASGDAALRFGNAGVNQWNMRNRPGDNYLEWFELGGGGSRMVIQDGTGNVGIGETANPTYKLDVLHGGSTGIRSRSSGSFSVVDIDAASGDAALRFAKAGVNQWNIRNRPADDYLEIFELGGGGSRVVIQDATGNVGIGETTSPSYKLDVLHGGSTGIRSRSSGSFSVVDIDAASGDAALRFANNGVNQWNTRNRPADDYYEIFELGGGGSRFVIQDGTGNVGIGETTSPSYKLDVLHGGSTGIRSRSSGSFSVVDIDAASGDAALRFAKAGVNQWNTRNRPADDYYEIFELGGGGSRFVIQDGTGNVGIGETANPTYKLDVLHGGSTGIRSRSSSSFSVVDIDAASGDAALRFAKAGVNQWNIRNNPATDDLQIFELGGGGERMRIENTTGNVVVTGNLSKGGGSFKIDHPLDPANKYLYHSFVESPDMMNIYNGNIVTDGSGKATVTLPAYFEALNMEFRYQLTVIGSFSQAIISKEVAGNKFEIATNQPNVKVSWQVTGIRHDNYANQNRIPNEVDKEKENKGKYLHPKAFGKPVTDGIGYDVTLPGASTIDASIPVAAKPAPPTTGGSLEQGAIVPPVTTQMEKAGSVADMPKPVKVEPNPLNSKGSVEDAPAAKKVEANPLNSKGSVEDVPAAAKKAEKAPVKTTEKGSTEQ